MSTWKAGGEKNRWLKDKGKMEDKKRTESYNLNAMSKNIRRKAEESKFLG